MARNQRQILGEFDRLNGRVLRKIAPRYRRETLGPLLRVIRDARGLKDLRRRLGVGLFRNMKVDALVEAGTQAAVQHGAIGIVTATLRKRRNVETKN